MPGVTVNRDLLFEKIGKKFSDNEFASLCFEYGIELDDVLTDEADGKGIVQYKIDIPANRYDLLCVEGLGFALGVFCQKRTAPIFKVIEPTQNKIITRVEPSTNPLRPFIVTAVLRNITLTPDRYNSLIDLQEKLHHNICRKRALVAIGVHDLDTLQPPFVYRTESPKSIEFVPLNQTKSFNAFDLLEFYKSDTHLKPYLHLINNEPRYPVIRDAKGTILSLPPIINGDHSKVSLKTKNLFFECTATDKTKANIVLDTMLSMFSEFSSKPYIFDATEVIYEKEGLSEVLPTLKYKEKVLNVQKVNTRVDIEWTSDEMIEGLKKMGLESNLVEDNDKNCIKVIVPPTRHDIIHTDDIIEDVAIAYGYSKIIAKLPPTSTVASQFPLNKLTSGLREGIAQAGFTEALTFSLTSVEDECEHLRVPRNEKEDTLVRINGSDFQAVRSTLLPGLLKTIAANKSMPLPLKLFEISDVVVLQNEDNDVGAVNKRNFCAVYYNKISGFEVIHGLLDRVMQLLEVKPGKEEGYSLRGVDDPSYLNGRCAEIMHKGNVIGKMGVVHPEVMNNFNLSLPSAAIEICIEDFL